MAEQKPRKARAAKESRVGAAKRETRAWLQQVRDERLQGLRFGGFTLAMLAVLVFGALALSPTLTTFLQQKAEIREIKTSLAQSQKSLDEAETLRKQWEDPAYVRAQARERLYYVMPGETQVGVIQDIVLPADNTKEASDKLTRADIAWDKALFASVLQAGATPQEEKK